MLGVPVEGEEGRGPNIAQKGYLTDIHEFGFADGRLKPYGPLTREEVSQFAES
ncbi:MAG TPA: hypothetical protein VIM11_13500 [Tepidisphaeraceae bacterium]|jgi:hypothetical protein